jgi:glucose/arabinose dehydrogenase
MLGIANPTFIFNNVTVKVFKALASIILIATLIFSYNRFVKPKSIIGHQPTIPKDQLFDGVGYSPVNPKSFKVNLVSDQLFSPTRIRITPDGKHLLVSQLTGEVVAFNKKGTAWGKPYMLTKIETSAPGFPPEESGLTSLVFASDYQSTGTIFLLHTYKDREGNLQNMVSRIEVSKFFGNLQSSDPIVIFTANTPAAPSHQITDGLGLEIEGQPHLLFLIGEGFVAERAQDPNIEGGKMMLIKADGSNPLGDRPFPDHRKIQALGIRNAYLLEQDSLTQRLIIADTGTDVIDRLIYSPLKIDNYLWDGSNESLLEPIPNPNNPNNTDVHLLRLVDTRTFTGASIHEGRGAIPQSSDQARTILLTQFGKTGLPQNEPGKKILMGQITNLEEQPKLDLTPIIVRNPEAEGFLGNPIGLSIDPLNGNFYFADIIEGKLYQVIILEGGEQQ